MVPGTLIMDLFVGNSMFQMPLGEHNCSALSKRSKPGESCLALDGLLHGQVWEELQDHLEEGDGVGS